jgi:D-alanyl-lipoteichoic acid acyltransferase DltB (MBOAT superfamily)
MLFNSLHYFLFLPAVYLAFYFTRERARWFVLLAASFLFYAALDAPYLPLLLILVTAITYGFGIWLDSTPAPRGKYILLWGGIAANVLILAVMKYLPFICGNLNALSSLFSLDIRLQPVKPLVAIGVSFYIFQAISYLVDIYFKIGKPERHFGYFALYLAFFPRLLQGPVERAGNLISQLKTRYEFNYDNIRSGILLFAWGLFKKIALADRLGIYADTVYGDVHAFTGLPLLLATYAYAFQLYMDLSGYTDMAMGSARLFNIDLTQNFNTPFTATSIADFWRRWHISLSRWILDYIFIPLRMQWRCLGRWGIVAALMVTFLLSGIWHGDSPGYIIWGALNGLYMACSVFYKTWQKKLHKALGIERTRLLKSWQILVTFNLLNFAWIFFRANSLSDAVYILKNVCELRGGSQILRPGDEENFIFILVACICYHLLRPFVINSGRLFQSRFRWIFYYALFLAIVYLGVFNNTRFLYLQF